MFTHFLQVAGQHVEHVHRVVVVLLVHVVLLILDVRLGILDQAFGELGEVVDIVQRVEDAVDQALRQLTGGGHLLQSNHLGRTVLDDELQPFLVLLQLAHAQTGEEIDECRHEQQIDDVHIPPEIERPVDLELDAGDLRQAVHRVPCLHIERVGAVGEVHKAGLAARRPCAPAAVVQAVAVEVFADDGGVGEREGELEVVLVVLQGWQDLRHLPEASPEDAVVVERDGADAQVGLEVQIGIIGLGVQDR